MPDPVSNSNSQVVTPVLSLIVIVYNSAPFLEACLASVEAQDLKGIEVVLVDDGSTDHSLSILARHAAQYPEHMRVVSCTNNGVSVARNTGLEHSTGKYVAFIDADDSFEPDYYRKLLNLALANDLDIAHGNATYHFDDGNRKDFPIYRDDLPAATVMSGSDVLRHRLRSRKLFHMVWMHVYRREFLDAMAMRFVPHLIQQDILWTMQAFRYAQRVAYDPGAGYYYRRSHWQPNQNPYDRRPQKVIPSLVYTVRGLSRIANGLSDEPELQRLFRRQMVDLALSIFAHLKNISDFSLRCIIYRQLYAKGLFATVWSNAQDFVQSKRVAKHWAKCLLWLCLPWISFFIAQVDDRVRFNLDKELDYFSDGVKPKVSRSSARWV